MFKLECAFNMDEVVPLIDKLLEKVNKKRGAEAVMAYREKLALLSKEEIKRVNQQLSRISFVGVILT